MISLDITDRQIKLVRGALNGNKVRVLQAITRDLNRDIVSNGYIMNIPILAGEISDIISSNKIKDKDIIICMSSGSVVSKDMLVPKFKQNNYKSLLKDIIQSELGVSSEYNISFKVLGEVITEGTENQLKVYATVCPQRLIDGYTNLCVQLGLNLKMLNIAESSVSRLVLNTPAFSKDMPFLLVQVDSGFLNFSLFEDDQLAFSKYMQISSDDYGNSKDYLNTALYDNVFRMMQFNKMRPGAKPLKEIVLYGEVKDFVNISRVLQSFNVPIRVMAMPASVVHYVDFDFSAYVNAIGTFYKPDKNLEFVNMAIAGGPKQSSNTPTTYLLALLLVSLTLCAGVYGVTAYQNHVINKNNQRIAAIDTQIKAERLEERQQELNAKNGILSNLELINTEAVKAYYLFNLYPKARNEIIEKLEEFARSKDDVSITDISISGSTVSANFTSLTDYGPSEYVEKLTKQGFFTNIIYNGYSGVMNSGGDNASEKTVEYYVFSLTLTIH